MFKHLLINKLKVLLRLKTLIFWTLFFPIILASFFKLALSNISKAGEFEPIKIAVIKNEILENEKNLESVIKQLSIENEKQVFETSYIEREEEANKLLQENKIEGYIIMQDNKKVDVKVKENGIEQTIIKYVIDEYYQTTSAGNHMVDFNYNVLFDGTINLLNESKEYIKEKPSDKIDFCMNFYYTAIAMACIYGGFFGIEGVKETEANLSKRAARVSISPVHKLKILFANIVAGFLIQYLEILILIGYIFIFLGGQFGNNLIWVLLLSLFGSFAGTSFGVLIGISNKKDENFKTGILIAITMTCCFFAGMMGTPMVKYSIEKSIPIVRYNPVSLITDGFHALYSYNTLDVYFEKVISILVFSIIMIGFSYIFIRRKKYDSI